MLRRAARDGDRLAKLGSSFHVIDTTTHQAGLGQNGAVLALLPAIADANGTAVLELNGSGNRPRQWIVHILSPHDRSQKLRLAQAIHAPSHEQFSSHSGSAAKTVS